MTKRNWKQVHPRSLSHAMELCVEHARQVHNRSVEQIADLIALPNKFTLYKWIDTCRMPSIMIRPFEHACGANYVTEYLASSSHKLLVDIPRGAKADKDDVLKLQLEFNDAIKLLAEFYEGNACAEDTIGTLTAFIARAAGHRENVRKSVAPELDLWGASHG